MSALFPDFSDYTVCFIVLVRQKVLRTVGGTHFHSNSVSSTFLIICMAILLLTTIEEFGEFLKHSAIEVVAEINKFTPIHCTLHVQ